MAAVMEERRKRSGLFLTAIQEAIDNLPEPPKEPSWWERVKTWLKVTK